MSRRRSFGRIRQLASGRWQVRYPSGDGRTLTAPTTFGTRSQAERFLATIRGRAASEPVSGSMTLAVYVEQWLGERPTILRPRTVELYRGLLTRHILPTFGDHPLDEISSASVRSWNAALRDTGLGESTRAKSYRLLKAICATAVEDELIARTPCRIRGAGVEHPQERVPPTIAEVEAIMAAIDPRFRVLVLLAAWSGLRYGELAGLTRQRIDPLHGVVHVVEQLIETANHQRMLAPPKTAAGVRTVAIPPHLWPDINEHLSLYVAPEFDAPVFCGAKGALLIRGNFAVVWRRAQTRAGVGPFHFHDLRHLAATMAAVSGATTRELMRRLGHSSSRAAMIYQHATEDRDQAIAEAMSQLVAPTPISSATPVRRTSGQHGVVLDHP